MLKFKLFTIFIYLRSLICGCGSEPADFERNKGAYKVERVASIPSEINESSGLALAGSGEFWTHEDGGGRAALFKFDLDKGLLKTLEFENLRNTDWEDLAQDTAGNIYIGDFGNNFNDRKNLRIYKYNPYQEILDTIAFHFADQDSFPPPKGEMNFDTEAFFWSKGRLHLFSKNRGEKCVKHYILPDQPGVHEALPIQEIYLKAMITAADISPDGSSVALLGYGKIYLFKMSKDGLLLNPDRCINFARGGQSEALVYFNDDDMLISNEAGKLFKARAK